MTARASVHRDLARVVAVAILFAGRAASAQPVFSGDPIDPDTGRPYLMLPGVVLFSPGKDEKFDTKDDVHDAASVGDVDLVLRTTAFGPTIPAPASSVATAPVVIAGGASTNRGTDAPFQIVLSDGVTPPAAGHPLTGSDLNGRGALILAFADLDGDGHIGPTTTDGNADTQLELQEILQPAGRQVAVLLGGVASGDIAVSVGAPASAGGLGIVVGAAAFTGTTPPLFDDNTFAVTLLPFLPPLDSKRFLGGNARAPDANYLIDVEFAVEPGRWYLPTAPDPFVGESLSIPLNGTSVSVDLLEARAGAASGAQLATAVDNASFVASQTRRLVAGVGPGGGRVVYEAATDVSIPDDGPGNGASFALFAADLLGNPTDPPPGGMQVVLEAGPGLAILSPDNDADPQRESIALADARAVNVVIDDAGGAADGPASARLTAVVGDAPTSSVLVTLIGGGVLVPTNTPTATGTPTPTSTTAPAATATETPTSTLTPEPTATSTPTSTLTPEPTATGTPTSTVALEPTATGTAIPTSTATEPPAPTSTQTPQATSTDTAAPTSTPSAAATSTDTSAPTSTQTPQPTATNTPAATSTSTSAPVASDTPQPTSTPTTAPTTPATPTLTSARVLLGFLPGANDVLRLAQATYSGAGLDPTAQDLTVSLTAGAQILYSRTFPARSLIVTANGSRFFHSDSPTRPGWTRVSVSRVRRLPDTYSLDLSAFRLDFKSLQAKDVASVTLTIKVGATVIQAPLHCTPFALGTMCAL